MKYQTYLFTFLLESYIIFLVGIEKNNRGDSVYLFPIHNDRMRNQKNGAVHVICILSAIILSIRPIAPRLSIPKLFSPSEEKDTEHTHPPPPGCSDKCT